MTENQRRNWYKFCSEPLDKIEHYEEAKADKFAGWCIHHRLEIQESKRVSRQELKDNDLYFNRPASELVFMKVCEHVTLHMLGNTCMKGHKHSEESRKKIAEAKKGKHLSSEHRKKLSEALKGKHNVKGKHWWNNGISSKHARECPGPEWKPGRLMLKRYSK